MTLTLAHPTPITPVHIPNHDRFSRAPSSPLSSLSPSPPPAVTVTTPPSDPAVPPTEIIQPKAGPSRLAADGEKEKLPVKKRRKTSLSITPGPDHSRAASTVTRLPPPNGKGKARASLPLTARQLGIAANNAAVQAAREAKGQKDALLGRSSPFVVDDDAPLPKVPRKGMGDDQPTPAESDVRAEGLMILEAVARQREERKRLSAAADKNSPFGRPNSPPLTGEESDLPPLQIVLPTNGNGDHSTSYRTPANTGEGFPDVASQLVPGPSRRGRQDAMTDEEFEREFEALKQLYSDPKRHTMPVFVDDPRPPKFHQGQRPTVVLAGQHSRMPGRVRDKHERAYLEGYDGLPDEYEREIVGFIDNVRVSPDLAQRRTAAIDRKSLS